MFEAIDRERPARFARIKRERELAARAQRAVVRVAVAVVQSTVNDAIASVYAAALESSMHD